MKIKNVSLDPKLIKAGPDDGLKEGEFIVYPSTFTRTPDAYGDVVAKGAFLKDIERWKESGNVLPGLYGHRMDDPDFFVAGAQEEGEDDHGWWVKGEFDLESPKGKQVYRLVKGRRLNQLSFAYDVVEEGKTTENLEGADSANELRELIRYEFSFVPVGANQDTSVVAVKAITDGLKAGRVLSAKNETSLREARDAIDEVLKAVQDDDDQGKASGDTETKTGASDEDPQGKSSVPAEESKSRPSAKTLLAAISIRERE